ncbi:single-strand DNA-binding protein [Flavobacterium nitrogenifigens]|uniref:Single-stranded DNA-binding protein n=2 Tax=Flavobacterium TaxID=237 RepID=A0A7W7J1P7_9FLAO|nr:MULTISPECIES: single-stranded DNA-binding protein [Flavobacterium]MBB4804562.1 single-strand DNA-binding protein [Flavobacterium nitrogenifigens]MBB6389521.1 single-strand DNA-binding protein [Flavobacterium notoginsengisoli]
MEITGRVTADAVVRKAGEKEVVNFSIAVNDRYKPKGSAEYKEVTVYINCSYWLSVKTAEYIKKGAVVQVSGRIGQHVYINNEGNPVGSIDFHVNSLSILVFVKRIDDDQNVEKGSAKNAKSRKAAGSANENTPDDLPF